MSREHAPTFGLTGGMGAGKSSVARRLSALGAEIVDADAIAKDLRRPGQLGFLALVDILGPDIVDKDGEIDRQKAASMIFPNPGLKETVDKTFHPIIWERMFQEASKIDKNTVTIFDVPLLKREHTETMTGVIVVNTSIPVAIERLAGRGFTEEEARARITTQLSNEERAAMADFIIVNDGTVAELDTQTEQAWTWMQAQV